MKTLDRVFLFAGLISLSFLIGVSSCDDDVKGKGDNRPTRQIIRTTLKDNVWKVVLEKQEAHRLNNYSFEFKPDGSVLAQADNTVVTGTWSAFAAGHGPLKINIQFAPAGPFNMLNDDWVVVESSHVRIVLVKATGLARKLDKLTLERV